MKKAHARRHEPKKELGCFGLGRCLEELGPCLVQVFRGDSALADALVCQGYAVRDFPGAALIAKDAHGRGDANLRGNFTETQGSLLAPSEGVHGVYCTQTGNDVSTKLSQFEGFASDNRALHGSAMSPNLKPPSALWAQAIFNYWRQHQPAGASVSEEAFAEAAQLSRGGFRKLLDGDSRPRFDTVQKLQAMAPKHLQNPESWSATPPQTPQVVDTSQMSEPHATSSGTPAVKGTHGKDLLELELESRIGVINDALYEALQGIIHNLRGAATSPEGARKTIDAFITAYAAGLRRRGNR